MKAKEMKKEMDFTGREVSCKAIQGLVEPLEKKGYTSEVLAEWSGCSLEHLLNKHERIDWPSLHRMMARMGGVFSDEELAELGGRWLKSPLQKLFNIVARLLYSPIEFYRWITHPEKGIGSQNFTCINPSLREIGPDHLVIELTMQRGYEPCREFFIITKGTFAAVPEALGLGPAAVEMEWIDGGARYDIRVPPGGGSLAWLRKAITWPFTARTAARELKMSLEFQHQRYAQLEKEMEERKESEERFRILSEGALAGVYIIQNDKFVYVNLALAETLGYTPDEIINTLGPLDLTHPDDRPQVAEQMRRRLNGEVKEVRYTARGLRKDGETVHSEILGSIGSYKGEPALIGTIVDITERVKREEKMMRRLMKYDLKEGKVYLVKESSAVMSEKAFEDLLNVGYTGYVFSRTSEEEFKEGLPGDYEFFWLAEMGENALNPGLGEIESRLQNLPRKAAVLIERLGYLVFKNGFKETLSFVQRLRDLAYLGGHVVITSVDPKTLRKRELSLLDKEALEVETLHKEALPDDLLEVLKYLYRQNSRGIKPSYTEVGKIMGISRPTVQKRIEFLNSSGYVMTAINGRRKVVELTEKGRSLFLR